jgi:hypothetical protein
LLLLGSFATDGAQAPEETAFRIGVNLVQVDAVVTDSKGRPEPDLDARDFEVAP